MIKAVRVFSAGVKEGNLMLKFLDDKDLRYDLALNQRAASEAFACLLQESKHLPYIDQATDEHPALNGVVFHSAIGPAMTPALVMQIGGVQIAIPLPKETRESLLSCIAQLEEIENSRGRVQ